MPFLQLFVPVCRYKLSFIWLKPQVAHSYLGYWFQWHQTMKQHHRLEFYLHMGTPNTWLSLGYILSRGNKNMQSIRSKWAEKSSAERTLMELLREQFHFSRIVEQSVLLSLLNNMEKYWEKATWCLKQKSFLKHGHLAFLSKAETHRIFERPKLLIRLLIHKEFKDSAKGSLNLKWF